MRSLIFFALLALSIVLTNGAAVEDYNEGKKHGLWTPDESFFQQYPNFWANWAYQPNKFSGIWSILGQTISPYFGTVV